MKYDIKNNFKKIEDIPCNLVYGDLNVVPNPVFSVVIPTYKRVDSLKETIESAVNQRGFEEPYEIIVVDNNDTDSDASNQVEIMIRELNIPNLLYYKNEKNIGGMGNWNRGVMLARSKWVIMCHDDDWMYDDCLLAMKEIIDKHSNDKLELGYVRSSADSWYGSNLQVQRIKRKHKRLKKSRTALIQQTYSNVIWTGGATWGGAPTCGTLLNKDALILIGGYNSELAPCSDCYVPYHMLGKFNVYKTYYPYGRYRWEDNATYKKTILLGLIKAYNDFLEILSKKHWIVNFFSNEHYADCVMYYRGKGKEAKVDISDEDITAIRQFKYSKCKLKILYFCRKLNSGLKVLAAK